MTMTVEQAMAFYANFKHGIDYDQADIEDAFTAIMTRDTSDQKEEDRLHQLALRVYDLPQPELRI